MTLRRISLALCTLALAASACNLQRVLDPSLPTSTPQSELQPTATPTLIPSPTPDESEQGRLEAGKRAFFYGDWQGAIDAYRSAIDESDEGPVQSAALLGIGRSYYQMGEYLLAKEVLNTQLGLYPDSSLRPEVLFTLAQVNQAQGNPLEAAEYYADYAEIGPHVLDSYVHEWRADALFDAGDYEGAISGYQAAAEAPRLGDSQALQVKIGDAYFQSGDYQSAILTYQSVFTSTTNDYVKAEMDLKMGRSYIALEQPNEGYALFLDAVNNYPLAFSAYAALVDLVNAGVEVDEYQRGLVDYYAANGLSASGDAGGAQELYSVAIAAFDRYLLANPDEHLSAAHHYRALSLRATGETQAAITEWDELIREHEFEPFWVDSYEQKAFTQWAYLEDYEAAIATLEGFVAATPSAERSAEFLYDAGRIAERSGRLTRSAELWQRVVNEYPDSEYAFQSAFLAGISLYRLDRVPEAQSMFNTARASALNLEDESQALFWIYKAQSALGKQAEADATLAETATLDPTGYYSERAADLLAGVEPFTPPDNYSLEVDLEAERAEAEVWMRQVFDLGETTNLSGPGELASDERYQRGIELWNLGLYEAARAEFESLRQAVSDDPADSYRLANALIDLGLYRTAIFAARQVLTLNGMSDLDTFEAPIYFNRVRFGTYYGDLVIPEAQSEGFDPLFVFSTMRQESLFEGFVTSSAGARGLMQIIPSTGREVATISAWPPNFSPDDLYRPIVSIRLGIDYLEIQSNAFDDDLYKVLAAYNAGPGWAQHWSGLAEGDMDLFVEVIHFPETSNHIRSIYELFSIYSDLYSQ